MPSFLSSGRCSASIGTRPPRVDDRVERAAEGDVDRNIAAADRHHHRRLEHERRDVAERDRFDADRVAVMRKVRARLHGTGGRVVANLHRRRLCRLLGIGRIRPAASQHIAAGEQECTVAGFGRLIRDGRIDLAQIDLSRCGFTQSMKIAAIAAEAGIRCANHCFTTDINVAAALHFLASIPNALILEYGVEPGEISRSLAREPIRIVDGHVAVPDTPGLGVEPNPAILERYLVRT